MALRQLSMGIALAFLFIYGQNNPPVSTIKLPAMKIASSVFKQGELIPAKHSCQGDDINPPLKISAVPASAKSLAMVMDDPDAPNGTWVHWIVFNIPPQIHELAENGVPANAIQGKNSWGKSKYGGPCPPSGSHRYLFKIYALDMMLSLNATADKKQLEAAMKDHIVEQAELMGTYQKR